MLLHQFSESSGRSTILVEAVCGGDGGYKSVWLEKIESTYGFSEFGASEAIVNKN